MFAQASMTPCSRACRFDNTITPFVHACKHGPIPLINAAHRYQDLSLDIEEKSVISLESALEKFTAVEYLSSDNLVDCNSCGCRRMVTKGLRLSSAPMVLCFHLKRFAYDNWGRVNRIAKHVKFPTEMSLKKYLPEDQGEGERGYELCGIVCHRGVSVTR